MSRPTVQKYCRHDIFPTYPVNEKVRRPLGKRLYLLWVFPLEKLRDASDERMDKPGAVHR